MWWLRSKYLDLPIQEFVLSENADLKLFVVSENAALQLAKTEILFKSKIVSFQLVEYPSLSGLIRSAYLCLDTPI